MLYWRALRQSVLVALAVIGVTPHPASATDYGIFERLLEASGTFAETTAALESSIAASKLTLHATHDLHYTGQQQAARIYLLTSAAYEEAARGEPPNSISAQILRIGVYEYGPGKKVHIDATNPVAHALVYYSASANSARLLSAAQAAEQELRDVVAHVPGAPVQVQLDPVRPENALRTFDGDGPAKMMAKWRDWKESQRLVFRAPAQAFAATVDAVEKSLQARPDTGVENSSGWSIVSKIAVGDNAVYFGISNLYTENKCVRINSDFRSAGKSSDAPHPGVDHAPALPLELLVVNDGTSTRVLQYGEMWRMQLYFWDSGYLAFARNTLIPGIIFSSIEDAVKAAAPHQ